jgi:hypothetical protein
VRASKSTWRSVGVTFVACGIPGQLLGRAGLKVCILGKACLAPIQPILIAQVTILGANIYFGDEQINIFRSTVLLENIF